MNKMDDPGMTPFNMDD